MPRYQAATAHIVDSLGVFSQQIDVVVFDRQYSPFIFKYQGQTIIPAESVYAVFEAKQTVNAALVTYAQEKVASVRRLHRTSLPIPYAKGTYPPKPLIPILGGLLTFESDWSPALGPSLKRTQRKGVSTSVVSPTAFLFKLIAQLQFSGMVPTIDVDAYAKWLLGGPAIPPLSRP